MNNISRYWTFVPGNQRSYVDSHRCLSVYYRQGHRYRISYGDTTSAEPWVCKQGMYISDKIIGLSVVLSRCHGCDTN